MAKREYIEANKKWLEDKAKEEGVQPLPRGIYYTAHYTGRTINGKQFDSSRGGVPLACRLCDSLSPASPAAPRSSSRSSYWALHNTLILPQITQICTDYP